ncbi:KAP family P-loop NTPase fold protein [Kribbella aluminosa]
MVDPIQLRLWDDNPTELDMLGFDAVVDTVAAAVCSPDLDPVTVALQSSWGGGKSSALKLIEMRLSEVDNVVVVRCDPWEYDDLPKSEVRALVIGQVLNRLVGEPGLVKKAENLLRRVAWVKVGATISNMVLARTVDVEKLADAFKPNAEEPTSMAGFHDEFEKLMEGAALHKVIVLVDDLDRCSPDSVVAILEAIKVFLSVRKMAFVLAAEEALIRYAIERSENAGARTTYSDRYLEKIVQLPVRLPTLSRDDAETFIALLLAERRGETNINALVRHVANRRGAGQRPYLGEPYPAGLPAPAGEDLALAAQIAQGISIDKWSSPRAIKRFLNAWGVRMAMASARGADLDLATMLKLYILEDRFPKDFEVLVACPPDARGALLDSWETWAKAPASDKSNGAPDLPEGISEDSRTWAASPPSLQTVSGKIDTYLTVAATFTSVSAGQGLPTEALQILDELLDASEPVRRGATARARALEPDVRAALVTRLIERAGAVGADQAIETAAEVAKADQMSAGAFHSAIVDFALPHLTPASVLDIGLVEGADATLAKVAATASLDEDVRGAADEELASSEGNV